ncbi:MAG TPA: hypothetical protein VLA13_08730 [Massilibacterium sp.]|nr:hypothetical protein [Massilibacterium sp.]
MFWNLRLYSYFHLKQTQGIIMKSNKVDLFLDSGGFSAWSQGVEIDIQEYIAFIKKHLDVIDVYANLDVIGDAEATYKNQRIMEKEGLCPLPVFHYGSDEKYLKRYLKKYDYISLGGLVPISTSALIPWLDYIFDTYITDDSGMPAVKVHGFGVTSLRLMLRYPWYSVDSTSWVTTGRMGGIYVPRYKNGEWLYDENSWKIAVSNRSPDAKEAGKHIETLPPTQKRIILDYIHEKGYKLGKSSFKKMPADYKPQDNERWAQKKAEIKNNERLLEVIEEEGISNRYQLRDEMNIIYFLDLEKSMQEWPWPFKKKANKGLGI